MVKKDVAKQQKQSEQEGTRMINELPTAFPWMYKDLTCTGMTLRDYFAGKALEVSIQQTKDSYGIEQKYVAKWCYEMADAMIEARGQANG